MNSVFKKLCNNLLFSFELKICGLCIQKNWISLTQPTFNEFRVMASAWLIYVVHCIVILWWIPSLAKPSAILRLLLEIVTYVRLLFSCIIARLLFLVCFVAHKYYISFRVLLTVVLQSIRVPRQAVFMVFFYLFKKIFCLVCVTYYLHWHYRYNYFIFLQKKCFQSI